MDMFWNKMETSLVERGLATVAATMCVKAPDNLKDMLVRAKLQFEGFDYATQLQKPHRESVRPVFALCHEMYNCSSSFSHQHVLCYNTK